MISALLAGCAAPRDAPLEEHGKAIVLLDPAVELGSDWEHRRLRRGDTVYRRTHSSLGHTVEAVGTESASILFRFFEEIGPRCGIMEWQWHVARPQPGSDLRVKGMDDVAASIFVMFGDPGIFRDAPVPTLRYVWANRSHREGEIIVGPYHERFVRTIIVRAGSGADEGLVTERTNLLEDYERAFGAPPGDGIHGIALFTDNDDTKEPIAAHYGPITLLCG